MSFQFEQKAGKIMDILSKITTTDITKTNYKLQDVEQFQKDLLESEQNNFSKLQKLHQKIAILHESLEQSGKRRQMTGQKLVSTILSIEKVIKTNLGNMEKKYSLKEKQIAHKVEELIKIHSNLIQESISMNQIQEKSIQQIENRISSLNHQINCMRKNRSELEDKIYQQFHNQIKQLKLVLEKDSFQREKRQNKMTEQLKVLYKKIMEGIKEQTAQRQANQRAFLKILQQLVNNLSTE